MKCAVFYGEHQIRQEEREIPVPYGNEILLKVMACGICGTDVHIYEGDKGAADTPLGTVLGHEFAGIVEMVGPDVSGFQPGDRVCVDPNQLCNECDFCRSAKGHFCEHMTGIGTTIDGGFSQYAVIPQSQLYKIGNDISYQAAAMAEPLACCIHGIDLCTIVPGSTVLIIGGGMIGLLMLQLAKIKGASKLILAEPVAEKRELAIRLGATFCIDAVNEQTNGILAKHDITQIDVVIECVGKSETIQQAIHLAGKQSTVMMFGLTKPEETIEICPYEVFKKEVVIKSSFINPYTQGRAIELIRTKTIDIESVIHATISLKELETVLRNPNMRSLGKYIVDPWK